MRFTIFAVAPALLLAACGDQGNNDQPTAAPEQGRTEALPQGADSMASNDAEAGDSAQIPDPEQRPIMQAQVILERQGFGPGVVDGAMGISTRNALLGFQEANGLDSTGELDEPTRQALARWSRIPATRVVTIPQEWGRIQYRKVPDDPAEQAKMDHLGYESLDEKLAERFHTTAEVLRQLNPGGMPAGAQGIAGGTASSTVVPSSGVSSPPSDSASPDAGASGVQTPIFRAGQQIRVPNVGADRIDPALVDDKEWLETLRSLGVGTDQPDVAKIVVDKSDGWLKAYGADGKLVAMFTVTTGSEHDPLPLGDWGITGIAHNPPFSYDPNLFWDVPDSHASQQLPPGPNGPVGVVWIDLTKEHYGIHGTSAPETIGRAESHGCVRLTNWDAARLAQMVDTNTEVVFQA